MSTKRARRLITLSLATAALAATAVGTQAAPGYASGATPQPPSGHGRLPMLVTYRAASPAPSVPGASGAAPNQVTSVTCQLDTGYAYLRTSFNKTAVGFKPVTTCPFPVTSISMTSQMYKYHDFGLFTTAQGAPSARDNQGEMSLTDRNIAVGCTDTKTTTWYGVTDGTVIIGGKPFYATAATPDADLACGTD
jgi:hypothetical protein